jgi:FMN-dependent NADH-azoreductase
VTYRLLHLDSSARSAHAAVPSATRTLSAALVSAIAGGNPGVSVDYRDLDAEPLPFVSQAWVNAAFGIETDDLSSLRHSEELIAELEAADLIVIGAPMYNYGIPASLKAWIDQVVRLGRTFDYLADGRPVGLLHGKRVVIVRSSGSDPAMLTTYGVDFHTPYLTAILAWVGITDVEVVSSWGVDPLDIAVSQADARERLTVLAAEYASWVPERAAALV